MENMECACRSLAVALARASCWILTGALVAVVEREVRLPRRWLRLIDEDSGGSFRDRRIWKKSAVDLFRDGFEHRTVRHIGIGVDGLDSVRADYDLQAVAQECDGSGERCPTNTRSFREQRIRRFTTVETAVARSSRRFR